MACPLRSLPHAKFVPDTIEAEVFIRQLQQEMREELAALDRTVPTNPDVSILEKAGGWIKLSPLVPQPEPSNLVALTIPAPKLANVHGLL